MTSYIEGGAGQKSVFNITSPTLVQAGVGLVGAVSVVVAGATAGTINDVATTGAAAASNAIIALPIAAQTFAPHWVVKNGIVVVPGTGQTIALTYS